MSNTFSLILVLVTLVTGIIWALEKLVFAKKRAEKVAQFATQAGAQDTSVVKQLETQPWWIENSVSIFPVIAFVLVLRSFIYEPFQIPSGSMMPTLLNGDFILVEKFAYGIKDPVWRSQLVDTGKPKRGDIAVFKYPVNQQIDYIKRVIGLPGDTIKYSADKQLCIQKAGKNTCHHVALAHGKESVFTANGYPLIQLDEKLGQVDHQILINPFSPNSISQYKPRPGIAEWVVPEGHYFAMGDNRDNSADSRYWGFVPEENLVGKAVAIWISFEFDRAKDSILPSWIPTGVRFNRIGGIN